MATHPLGSHLPPALEQQVEAALDAVRDELRRAMAKNEPMHSAHEGHAVIREEHDELWDEVMLKPAERDRSKMRHEAMQIAAMAVRFMVDVVPVQPDALPPLKIR